MIKKRFQFNLCPNGYHYLYFENELYTTTRGDYIILEQSDDVEELLDELNNENQQLKDKIKKLEIENEAQSDAIDGLHETLAHLNLEDIE